MNSFIYLLSDKFFTVKIQIFETGRYQPNIPYEHSTLIVALSCKYEISFFCCLVEKQHPENFQFKAHEPHFNSFPKINNKKKSPLKGNKKVKK